MTGMASLVPRQLLLRSSAAPHRAFSHSTLASAASPSAPSTSSSPPSSSTSSASATESPNSSSSSSSSSRTTRRPHDFVATKSATTGRWRPPRLSLRRQAQLARLAWQSGTLEQLASVGSPKVEALLRRQQYWQSSSSSSSSSTTTSTSTSDPQQPTASPSHAEPPEPIAVARDFLASQSHGPYLGRLRAAQRRLASQAAMSEQQRQHLAQRGPRPSLTLFKGTWAQRTRDARGEAVQQKLEEMDAVVDEWKKSRKEAKAKQRPLLPF